MAGRIQDEQTGKPRPRLSKIALVVALLAGLASVPRIFAHDDKKEPATNGRDDRDGGDDRDSRDDRDDRDDHHDRDDRDDREHKSKHEGHEKDHRAHRPAWRTIGHDSRNTRNQPFEWRIGPWNVSHLSPKWVATTTGDVSGTPAVAHGAVYFGDFGGTVWKLDAETGKKIWSISVPDYTGNAGDYARTSPSHRGQYARGRRHQGPDGGLPFPNMLGIDATTGALRWKTQIHPDFHAAMTGSPVLVGDTIITGISANGAGGATATFRGAIVALDAHTGASCGGPTRSRTTAAFQEAMRAPRCSRHLPSTVRTDSSTARSGRRTRNRRASPLAMRPHGGFTESCEQRGSYLKSIVAFDLKTGKPKWSYRVLGHGPWVQACGSQPATVTWCAPESDGEKWDIGGSGANVMRMQDPRALA